MKSNRFLLVDIGNTSTHLAVTRAFRILREYRIPTASLGRSAARVQKILRTHAIQKVVVASVVPSATKGIQKIAREVPCLVLGRDLAVPVGNRARYPKQVGIDRLLNALAAHKLFKREAIVVDFGTAITFDVVSKRGEYLGGVIAPGIEITLDALNKRTALLPKISLKHPRSRIGRDTVECIRIGSSVGIGGLCDRILEEISAEMGKKPLIVATGGYADFMRRYSKKIRRIEPRLTLLGILHCLA